MQALKRLRQKGTCQDKAMLSSAKIKPIALAVIELRLSKGISKLVSKGVSQSAEIQLKEKIFKIL